MDGTTEPTLAEMDDRTLVETAQLVAGCAAAGIGLVPDELAGLIRELCSRLEARDA